MGLTHLADTSALIGPPAFPADAVMAMSVICLGELEAGVLLARSDAQRAERVSRLSGFAAGMTILPIDGAVASAYARLRAQTRRRPSNDLWIAATAIAHALRLVTRDERLAQLPGVDALVV